MSAQQSLWSHEPVKAIECPQLGISLHTSIRPYVQALFSNCNLRIYTISVNLTIEILHASSLFSVKCLNVMSRISLHVKPVICLIKG